MKSAHMFMIFFLLMSFLPSQAQEGAPAMFVANDYSFVKLPPLSELFENSRKSAAVEYFNVKREEQESLLKTEKRSWMKYFSVGGNYQYGTGVINTSSNVENASMYQYSNSKQSWYNMGASVSIPVDDIFDRPNRIKRQKLEMQATQVEVEKWHDEQKLRIIEAYTNAEQLLSVLKVKVEALTLANAQYKLAENDFINEKINVQELNNQKSYQVSAFTDYQETRSLLKNALLQLEVLSKTVIINQ